MEYKDLMEVVADVLENEYISEIDKKYQYVDYNNKIGSNLIGELHNNGVVITAIDSTLFDNDVVRIWVSEYEPTTKEFEVTETVERNVIEIK